MNSEDLEKYHRIRAGEAGFYEQKRGLIEVSGKEAVQFLNGLITNDAAKLEENSQMLAAFPNAQGRLLAVVRVLRIGDKFLFETEAATHEKVYNNLFRFTFAGDFYVEDLSENYSYFSMTNDKLQITNSIEFQSRFGRDIFVPKDSANEFKSNLKDAIEISDELYETLRIEQGIPLYGVDMDETTIVPEIGLTDIISYNKGCYIGQEIIARIHFRGHIAKQLRGLIFEPIPKASETNLNLTETSSSPVKYEVVAFAKLNAAALSNVPLQTEDGKNAGRMTSVIFSPSLERVIALAYVRYDYLAEGTELKIGELTAKVKNLPFNE